MGWTQKQEIYVPYSCLIPALLAHTKKKKFLRHGTKSCFLLFRDAPFLSPDIANGYPDWYLFVLFSPTKQILSEKLKIGRDHISKRLTGEVI
jgi:hypothetical protein